MVEKSVRKYFRAYCPREGNPDYERCISCRGRQVKFIYIGEIKSSKRSFSQYDCPKSQHTFTKGTIEKYNKIRK